MAKRRTGYLIRRGRIYHACWTVAGKKFWKSTGKSDRRKAQTELARIMEPFLVEDEVKTLEHVKARIEGAKAELTEINERRDPLLAISAAWGAYITSTNRPDSGPKTLATYELQWGRFVAWMSINYPATTALRDVTPNMASAFISHLSTDKRSSGTINKYITLLRCVFRVLKGKARLTNNPLDGIIKHRDIKHGRRELTIDELHRVCQQAKGDIQLLLAIGLYTGLRLADACTLRWDEVDLARRIIRRVPSKTARRSPTPVLIPIYTALYDMLASVPAPKRKGHILPRIAEDYVRHPSYVTDRLQRHFQSCGIQTQCEMPGRKLAVVEVGFHSLRHSFVSLCRAANAPLAVVEAIVGHSNPAMTRHYTHVGEVAAAQAVAALPSVFTTAKALPAPHDDNSIPRATIRALGERLGAKNWPQIKAELLTLSGES